MNRITILCLLIVSIALVPEMAKGKKKKEEPGEGKTVVKQLLSITDLEISLRDRKESEIFTLDDNVKYKDKDGNDVTVEEAKKFRFVKVEVADGNIATMVTEVAKGGGKDNKDNKDSKEKKEKKKKRGKKENPPEAEQG